MSIRSTLQNLALVTTIDTTICVGGYSASIRPSTSFTNKRKAKHTNAGDKDAVEFKLYRAVCDGRAGLREAQAALLADWRTALSSIGL